MEKETKRKVKITLTGVLLVLLLLVGASFAVFNTSLEGEKVQKIKAGCLKVEMTDQGDVTIANAAPETDEEGLEESPYTYTIKNTCTTDAYYISTLNVLNNNNTNIENISKIKVALDGDSFLRPTYISDLEETEKVTEEENISKTYKIDEGYLKVGEERTFNLRNWIDYNVESINGGLQSKIIVKSEARDKQIIEYKTNTSGYYVLSKNGLLKDVDYTKNIQNGIVNVSSNENIKYYLRGTVNNNISLGGKLYNILSTNNDGSINVVSKYGTITESDLTAFSDYIKEDNEYCITNSELDKSIITNNKPSGCTSTETKKIGSLNANDLVYSGNVYNSTLNNYLKRDYSYKVGTSYIYDKEQNKVIESTSNVVENQVIALKGNTLLKGEGTTDNPFYINGVYENYKNDYKDTTKPVITNAKIEDKWTNTNKSIIISASSKKNNIEGYIVKSTNETPSITDSEWEISNSNKYTTVNKFDNGTYYVFVKTKDGIISESKKVIVNKVDKISPTCTININPNGEVTNYKMLEIKSTDTNIDKKGYSWDHTEDKTEVIKINKNGVYTAHIKDEAGNTSSCSATITTVLTKPNEPELTSNMIPVYYDEASSSWKKADSKNSKEEYKWYDYDNKIWANAVTVTETNRTTYLNASVGTTIPMDAINTMWVWIPRYTYTYLNTNTPQEIDITFEKGTSSSGTISCSDTATGTSSTSETCTDSTNGSLIAGTSTYTHPAFWWDKNDNNTRESGEELTGIWVGKFEVSSDTTCSASREDAVGSGCNLQTIRPKIIPNATSWRGAMVGTFFNDIYNMRESGNQYGFKTTDETHMMKNMEWGAVTYLYHSKYGRCINGTCEEVTINNCSNFITGIGADTVSASESSTTCTTDANKYNRAKGVLASTTGNIYGIYDMSGGAVEYMMGDMISSTGVMMSGNQTKYNAHSGFTGYLYRGGNYTGTYDFPNKRYYDKYSYGTSSAEYTRGKLGDATKEMAPSSSSERAWYSDSASFPQSYNSWFLRGSHYNYGSDAGLFSFQRGCGDANSYYSARAVVFGTLD